MSLLASEDVQGALLTGASGGNVGLGMVRRASALREQNVASQARASGRHERSSLGRPLAGPAARQHGSDAYRRGVSVRKRTYRECGALSPAVSRIVASTKRKLHQLAERRVG